MTGRKLSENGFRVEVAGELGKMSQQLVEHNRRIGNVEKLMAENTKSLDSLIITVSSNRAVSKTRIRDIGLAGACIVGLASLLEIVINLHQVLAVFGFR
jgi:hypothetical protein